MQIYSLYDRKLREYGALFLSQNDATVKRAIHEGIPAGSTVGKYPEDYDVMLIGDFDPVTGVLEQGNIVLVDNVRDILRGRNPEEASDAIS